MTSVAITGIAELITNDADQGDGSPLGLLTDAVIVVQDQTLLWVGPRTCAPAADRSIDVGGRAVLPGFVDSHSHLVFAGDRSGEFVARMAGRGYDGGGIGTTVTATREASQEQLRSLLLARMAELRLQGTTSVEIKSGYGLTISDEVRLLELAREFTAETTFLGAHVVPADMARDDYLELVTGAMLEACAPHARWIDVFCEPGSAHAFNAEESRAVLTAGRRAGLELRMHGNQLGPGPGVQLAVELEAASVDHCTYLTPTDIDALARSKTVATLLPGVEFSTRSPYPDARALLDAGATVALATDCNPGTCYSSSMPLMIALAVRELRMTPAEAVWAATAGGAKALRRTDIGALRPGTRADLALLDAPTYVHLAYRPGVPIARTLDVTEDL